ncbi:hypothetical protein VE04_06017 [Pseudogymnoascus sp. 24MN13]|nr:hypothetical protein VE04_06017 [Pseudogymnoascus sp. 24MN13]
MNYSTLAIVTTTRIMDPNRNFSLPPPRPDQTFVTVSAIDGGSITLPDRCFVTPSNPDERRTVPSLAFLIEHPRAHLFKHNGLADKPFRFMFDLGLRSELRRYIPAQQAHLVHREPYLLGPGVVGNLKKRSLTPADINAVVLSHVHYDHHGDPEDFDQSTFIVGSGSLEILQNGLPGTTATHQCFDPNLLPKNRTVEFPPVSSNGMRTKMPNGTSVEWSWDSIGPFPAALDLFGDNSDIILTMVPEGSHVKAVYLTPRTGVLAADVSSKLLIDCSTIDTATSLLVRESVTAKFPSALFYDSPVSGGSLGAAKATLTFMVGCAEDNVHYKLLRDLLGMMGTSIFPCGGPSLGLTAKLSNNYCSGLIAIATSEAMNIGMKSGMDPRVLASIFRTSTAQSCISDKWNPVPGICPEAPASHGYAGGFKVQLMEKDFGLAVKAAEAVGAKLVLGDAGLQTYAGASKDSRCRDLDSRVIFRYLGGNEAWAQDLEGKQ